jgi:phenylacetate-CoA oxygenase PaaH subunit
MSKFREQVPIKAGEPLSPPEGDLKPYEVFVQLENGKPHVYAGSVDAVDDAMALQFAREHYGRDQPCVNVWAVSRSAIVATDETEVVWRLSDQSYRQAKGYAVVRKKWDAVRRKKDVDEYVKEDLKEGF